VETSTELEPARSLEAQDTQIARKHQVERPARRLTRDERLEPVPEPSTRTEPYRGRAGMALQSPVGPEAAMPPARVPKQQRQVSFEVLTSAGQVATRQSDGAETEVPPRTVYSPAPIYPAAELSAGIGGRVKIYVQLDASGAVLQARVYRTSGVTALDQAALRAVRRWKFEPLKAAHPTARQLVVPVRFQPPG
jgi:protein TonB